MTASLPCLSGLIVAPSEREHTYVLPSSPYDCLPLNHLQDLRTLRPKVLDTIFYYGFGCDRLSPIPAKLSKQN